MIATQEKNPPRQAPGTGRGNTVCGKSSISGVKGKKSFDVDTLEAMRRRLPEYLANRGVKLHKRGERLVGKCPVHEDSNPSFAVLSSGKDCGCYPCGFCGDVFAVSQWMGRASSFVEAVRDVAGVLGVYLPDSTAGTATRHATPPQRPAKQPEPPFTLSAGDREKLNAARLAWCDAFHSGDPIADEIAASLGLTRETLRFASWGESGLGLAAGLYGKPTWICYAYRHGLKWRNPDPQGKPRFEWLVGKATTPWRMEWALRPEVRTIYLTEGESDTLALIEAGMEEDGTAVCVASPGTSFSQAWAGLFAGKRVVLCFDLDEAGRAAAVRVAAILKGHASEILTWKGYRQ